MVTSAPNLIRVTIAVQFKKSLSSISAILFISPIFAQQQNNESDNIERITTTSSRFVTDALKHPGSLEWLDESELNRINPAHIQQALVRIAGVNLHRGNGQEYLPSVRSPVFTGAGACGELLTAEDGIPLRAAGFCNINELFEAGTEYAQSIDVLKGPGTVIYGSNAIHGVVNVITQNPIWSPATASVDLGSYGYKRAGFNLGNQQQQHGFGVNFSITDDSGYRDDESVEQNKMHIRYEYQASDFNLEAGLSVSDLEQETAGFIIGLNSYLDENIAQSNANPEAYRNASATRLWVKLSGDMQLKLSTEPVKWQVTPYVRDQDMDFLMHFLPGQPIEDNAQQSMGVQSSMQFTLSPNVTLLIGADAEATSAELTQFQPNPTQGSAFLMATIPAGLQYDYEVDADMFSLFSSVAWQLSDALQLDVGGRFERINYDYNNQMLSGRTDAEGNSCGFGGCRYSRPPSGENSFSEFSPQASITYSLDADQLAYMSLSQGYRAPQATELYRLQRNQSIAELDSVEAQNIEVGYKYLTQAIDVRLAAYHMDKDNVIFRDSDFFNVSNGETRHQGIELSIRYQLLPNLAFATAMTYARHQYRNNQGSSEIAGNDMDTAPRTLANAQLLWQVNDSMDLELDWIHSGDYFLEPENQQRYSGHNIFNLLGSWQISDNLALSAQLTNLFDKEYAERADFTGFSGHRYFPGRPRSGLVGMEYQF